MNQYTDYLGNPISVGDEIVYPIASGSSGADMQRATVLEIDEIIIPDPNEERASGVLHSQRFKPDPTLYRVPFRDYRAGDYRPDMSKAYGLMVRKHNTASHKRVRIKNVDRVVVVTSLV